MTYQELISSPLLPPHVIALAHKAAGNNISVLIRGEEGTEKELVAKVIHYSGEWKTHRFQRMDCKLMAEETFDRHFYHFFKEIDLSRTPMTLFLKEVGSLSEMAQLRLIELLDEGIFQRGNEQCVLPQVRILSSSSENLKEKVRQGKFSEDLYDRLSPLSIYVPPLRERAQDIPQIAQYLLEEHSKKMKIPKAGISDKVVKLLQSYWWPGNLRELKYVIIRSALCSEGETLMEKDLFFETENEKNPFISYLKKGEDDPREFQNEVFSDHGETQNLPLFFMELVHRIKNPLVSIKTFTQLLREKFGDLEFRDYFYKIVTEDIDKIDSVLNGLLNYIRVNTPIEKANTVHSILEDALKNHEPQLESKKIKVFKKYEKELPETTVHEEQLRYILSSLLQYAIPSVPLHGSIGLLTKSTPTEPEKEKPLLQKNGRFVEIMVIFTGLRKSSEPFESVLGIPTAGKDAAIELELRLIKEIIQKNRGMMKYETNEQKSQTTISLKFPIERRKLIYYPSTRS
jgi:nitrogen-specific signal transduction histidine kinase